MAERTSEHKRMNTSGDDGGAAVAIATTAKKRNQSRIALAKIQIDLMKFVNLLLLMPTILYIYITQSPY